MKSHKPTLYPTLKIHWHQPPTIINVGPDVLEIHENITSVRFFRHIVVRPSMTHDIISQLNIIAKSSAVTEGTTTVRTLAGIITFPRCELNIERWSRVRFSVGVIFFNFSVIVRLIQLIHIMFKIRVSVNAIFTEQRLDFYLVSA